MPLWRKSGRRALESVMPTNTKCSRILMPVPGGWFFLLSCGLKNLSVKRSPFSLRESVCCQGGWGPSDTSLPRRVHIHSSHILVLFRADTMEQQRCLHWILRSMFSRGQAPKCWAHRQAQPCQYDFIFIPTTSLSLNNSLWRHCYEPSGSLSLLSPVAKICCLCVNMHMCHGSGVCVCVLACVYMHACTTECNVDITGQFSGANSFLPSHES